GREGMVASSVIVPGAGARGYGSQQCHSSGCRGEGTVASSVIVPGAGAKGR
ncbi:predicted protein, partial [Nematostella vectensis]